MTGSKQKDKQARGGDMIERKKRHLYNVIINGPNNPIPDSRVLIFMLDFSVVVTFESFVGKISTTSVLHVMQSLACQTFLGFSILFPGPHKPALCRLCAVFPSPN
jgi:hypothetical protein